MDHRILRIILVQFFSLFVFTNSQQSPCPNYFRYVQDRSTNEILGHIEIPNPPTGVALHVKVGLSIAAALQSKYVGRVELAHSKEESIKAVQQGRPLQYRIHFPLPHPLPLLTALSFNEQRYCSGPRASGRLVTSIYLEHTLYPPGILPLSQGNTPSTEPPSNQIFALPTVPASNQIFTLPTAPPSYSYPGSSNTGSVFPLPADVFTNTPQNSNSNNNFNLDFNPFNSNRNPTTTPAPTVNSIPANNNVFGNDNINININPNPNQDVSPSSATNTDVGTVVKQDPECGRSNINTNINLLIARGMATSPGQWPWLVAIFIVKIEFEFQCAGTLVNNRHVITAAHCFKLDNADVPASALLISVGRYRLRDWREKGSVNREVAEYKFHPNYKHTGSADSDLAIITLRETVEFSEFIRPICFWTGPKKLDSIVGKSGYVVGWGRDEVGNPYLSEPRMSRVPIVSQEDCLWSNTDFVSFTSNRTFCAGSRNGSGPCNGDSGSGLVIRDPASRRYQLRGVVSRSLLDSNTMSCDLTQYVVYVDVAKNMDWIQEQIGT